MQCPGHVDAGESELETALRETKEESGFGLDQLLLIDSFKKELNYHVNERPKRVVYWLAQLKDPATPVLLSDEHTEYKWLSIADNNELRQFPDMYKVFCEAETYIQENVLS